VVAVDPRWLERSLNETYNPSGATPDGETPQEPVHQFNAHNYLEKIFQIPFSLPAMNEGGYRKLVSGLINKPRAEAERRQAESLREREKMEEPEPPPDDTVETQDDKEKRDLTNQERKEQEEAERRRSEQAEEERLKREQEEEERKKQEQERERERVQERIESMLLHEGEEQFIAALYRFIETPRLAKRFINVYRLIRVRASMIEEDFSTFSDQAAGAYRAVLMLLAVCIGNADVAPEILDDLQECTDSSFAAGLEALARRYEAELVRVKAERAARKDNPPPGSHEKRLIELCAALVGIQKDIAAVRGSLAEHGGPAVEDSLEPYQKWAREVGRYSFRWHIKADM
jgi:hypothetical protein